jgi:predicted acetyltransferase
MDSSALELRPLRLSDETAFRHALAAYEASPSLGEFALEFRDRNDFPSYVRDLDHWSRGEALPPGWVSSSFYVGVVGDTIVGRLSFRHSLTKYLLNYGGHIGYAVVPEFRGRGYATAMVQKALPRCAALGLDRVLLTCDADNLASKHIIEKCGGVFESSDTEPNSLVPKLRYWIRVSPVAAK